MRFMRNYIIYTSAYNEEANIEKVLNSVIKQTLLPKEWLIVNDGSTDNTANIINSYAENYPFIKLINKSKGNVDFGAHVGINWQHAKRKIQFMDWNYFAQLDADIEIDRCDFYENQIELFEEDPQLGITSGLTYAIINNRKIITKRPYWRTGGATKFYRRECFEQIGEILPILAWDGIDVYKAMYWGWKSRTCFELHVNHLGKERMLFRENQKQKAFFNGKNMYQRGFPIEFIVAKSISNLFHSGHHFINFLKGYIVAMKRKEMQFVDKNEKQFIRKIQYLRILDFFTKKQLL